MSVHRAVLTITLSLIISPLEQVAAQRMAPAGITRSARVSTDPTTLPEPRLPCGYVKIVGYTLYGAAIGFMTAIPFPSDMQQQKGIAVAAGALIGAAVGVVKAKRAGCLDKPRPTPPPPTQGH